MKGLLNRMAVGINSSGIPSVWTTSVWEIGQILMLRWGTQKHKKHLCSVHSIGLVYKGHYCSYDIEIFDVYH